MVSKPLPKRFIREDRTGHPLLDAGISTITLLRAPPTGIHNALTGHRAHYLLQFLGLELITSSSTSEGEEDSIDWEAEIC